MRRELKPGVKVRQKKGTWTGEIVQYDMEGFYVVKVYRWMIWHEDDMVVVGEKQGNDGKEA